MKLPAIFTLFILSLEVSAFSMGEAINLAGRQRMLSQRIAQTYILQGIQPGIQRHEKVFKRSIQEFEQNHRKLSAFPKAGKLSPQLLKVQQEWKAFERITRQPASRGTATELFRLSNRLLSAAHTYVVKLERLANHNSAELINIAGRQRMLSQRIAKNYAAKRWGISPGDAEIGLQRDLAEYTHRLNQLLDSPLNTPEINRNLRKALDHLNYANRGFTGEMQISEKRQLHVITGTTDLMLRNMNIITKQYAALLDSEGAIENLGSVH
ncbi:type IV pili methyl-accepting chemotaxis transducer N-terminal domain-containing protein [Microbulbifer sp. 2304DJ12-6]|uniref:type IV pili methyl-accepting chemotaxis transducer N-terminal domain-containing protein n=1 Tax=Microbulbifer sp. 2304DJ12-6 TaxID=3233340 RepID=UPI0039B0B00D